MRFKHAILTSVILFVCLFLLWRFVRPLNIFVVDKKFERPIRIETPRGLNSVSAKECSGCHEDIYREWSKSMHANAWKDPYFQADYAYDGSQQICQNCHIPLENQQENLVLGFRDRNKFKPILKPNPDFDPDLQNEGVTCAVCHIRNGKIVGPFETDTAPHPVEVDTEMTTGMKYCERCHVVSGKRWDTFYRIPPCGTVAEIQEGDRKPDCVGCHMPEIIRPVVKGMEKRKGRKHLFQGGHHPEMVKRDLRVEYKKEVDEDSIKYIFILTNVGTAHYLPTGTPDRYLTLELKLHDKNGQIIKEKTYKMKRYILWRPFIIDLKDTRLPYGKPRRFIFEFSRYNNVSTLDVTIRYHLLDEKRRKKIGYRNKKPISYPIHKRIIPIE